MFSIKLFYKILEHYYKKDEKSFKSAIKIFYKKHNLGIDK